MTATSTSKMDAVVQALDRIAATDPDGLIQPEKVVEVAADLNSPLHEHFEWDDSEAAHQYRLVQARHLVKDIRVVRSGEQTRYANVQIVHGNGQVRRGYVPVERAVADPDLYEQVVQETMKSLRAYRQRLAAFQRARTALKALDEAVHGLELTLEKKDSDG